MRTTVLRLSVLPPFSPRLIHAFHASSRRSRRAENCRNGSTLERASVMAWLPGLPSWTAAWAAASRTEAGRPSRSVSPSEHHVPGLLVGQHVLCENAVPRVASSVLISEIRLRALASRAAPART
jgi:hypothetical protein